MLDISIFAFQSGTWVSSTSIYPLFYPYFGSYMHCSMSENHLRLLLPIYLRMIQLWALCGLRSYHWRFSSFLALGKWMFELQRSTLNMNPLYFSRSDALSAFRAIFFFPGRAAPRTKPYTPGCSQPSLFNWISLAGIDRLSDFCFRECGWLLFRLLHLLVDILSHFREPISLGIYWASQKTRIGFERATPLLLLDELPCQPCHLVDIIQSYVRLSCFTGYILPGLMCSCVRC